MIIETQRYGLKDFKELMEKRMKECDDPMNIPFGCDPYSQDSINRRMRDKATYSYVPEMMPDQIEIARHSQRLVAKLQIENAMLHSENNKHVDTIEQLERENDSLNNSLSDAYAQRGY